MGHRRTFKKQQTAETGLMRSACGNSVVANKGIRKPNPDRFKAHKPSDPPPAFSLRALADQMYREDHDG